MEIVSNIDAGIAIKQLCLQIKEEKNRLRTFIDDKERVLSEIETLNNLVDKGKKMIIFKLEKTKDLKYHNLSRQVIETTKIFNDLNLNPDDISKLSSEEVLKILDIRSNKIKAEKELTDYVMNEITYELLSA